MQSSTTTIHYLKNHKNANTAGRSSNKTTQLMQKGYMRPVNTYIQATLRENESGSFIYELYFY